jgi:hypothetical protein
MRPLNPRKLLSAVKGGWLFGRGAADQRSRASTRQRGVSGAVAFLRAGPLLPHAAGNQAKRPPSAAKPLRFKMTYILERRSRDYRQPRDYEADCPYGEPNNNAR